MKKSFVLGLIAAVMVMGLGLGTAVFAQDQGQEMRKGMWKSGEEKEHGMMKGCPMAGKMKAMMERAVVATTDGGVVVLAGNKLVKYDKDLNVVKEVEIKIDTEAMKKEMMEMMKNCPMMKDKMAADDDAVVPPPAAAVEEKK